MSKQVQNHVEETERLLLKLFVLTLRGLIDRIHPVHTLRLQNQ